MGRSKKSLQWVGGGVIKEAESDGSTTPSEVIQLVPAIPIADAQGAPAKCVIKAVYLHFSSRRILLSQIDAFGFIMWVANRQENSDLPIQSLNAIATASGPYANKAILLNAPLNVPPVILQNSTGPIFNTGDGLIAEHHTYEAERRLDRNSQILCLNLNSDLSVVMRTFVQWRVLLAYG